MNHYSLLPQYSSFLLAESFTALVNNFIEDRKAEKINGQSFFGANYNPEKSEVEAEFRDLLSSIINNKGDSYIEKSVRNWKESQSGLAADKVTATALVASINARKTTLIRFSKYYTQDFERREQIVLELIQFYSFYFIKLMEAFSELQHEKILQERDFTQAIINNSIDAISAFDTELNVLEWNTGMERSMGIKKEEIIGKNYFDFFPEYQGTAEAEFFRNTLKGESYTLLERPYYGRKGWYNAHFLPLFDKDKKVIGGLSIVHDVTERKESEDKIRENQHFIQTLADSSPDVITVYDLVNGKNIYSSKEIFEILGYKPEELKALVEKGVQGLVETIHPDDLPKVLHFLESYKTYMGDDARDLEYRIKDSRGDYKWILDRYSVFKRNSEGLPTQIIGIARDNTMRKQAEEKLSEYANEIEAANEELRAANETISIYSKELEAARDYYIHILNDFPALIWRTDVSGNCNYFNNEWLRYTGRLLEQELGDGWTQGVHHEDVDRRNKVFKNAVRNRESFVTEYRLKSAKGEFRFVMDIARPLFDIEGEFIGFLGACFDIQDKKDFEIEMHEKNQELSAALEELKSAEESLVELNGELEQRVNRRTQELQESNEKLIRINADLDNFIYTASHDLKAPISNIEGLMETLKRNLPKDSANNAMVSKVLSLVDNSVERFKKTISDLTEISKVQKEEGKDISLIDLRTLIIEVRQDLEYLIASEELEFESDFDDLPKVLFSHRNMRSILYNLISNAIKYRSRERKLQIRLASESRNGYDTITVEDNGLGIDISQKDKIFTMFKRLHTHVEGSGVGLYIVKKIVDNAGGKIEVESEVGKGSRFTFYLKRLS